MMASEKVDLLSDHYKESCGLSKDAQSDRNKMFLYVCFVATIQSLFIIEPASIILIVTSWLKDTYGIDVSIQLDTIQVLLWMILLYCTMRYYQLNCYVERQYKYIHSLERRITELAEVTIDRESNNYLTSYPKVLDGIHVIYTWIFPILFEIVISIKIVTEIKNSRFGLPIVINCIVFLCCFLLTILYFQFLRNKK